MNLRLLSKARFWVTVSLPLRGSFPEHPKAKEGKTDIQVKGHCLVVKMIEEVGFVDGELREAIEAADRRES